MYIQYHNLMMMMKKSRIMNILCNVNKTRGGWGDVGVVDMYV